MALGLLGYLSPRSVNDKSDYAYKYVYTRSMLDKLLVNFSEEYILERLTSRVIDWEDCWLVGGSPHKREYRQLQFKKGIFNRMIAAHRLSYELFIGPIAAELTIDHLCENGACINPNHLEPVSRETNALRWHRNHAKSECLRGHEYTNKNTYYDKRGYKSCRVCKNIRERSLRQHA